MQINHLMGQHSAFLASVSNSKLSQNSRSGGQIPDQTGAPATISPAAIASFGEITSYMNLLTYSPTDLSTLVEEQTANPSSNMPIRERMETQSGTDLSHKEIEAYITALRAQRAAPKPELQLVLYENDSIAYGLARAFDKMSGYLFEKYNIKEQLIANTREGTLFGLKGEVSNAQQVLNDNPIYAEFQKLKQVLTQADENGRTAFHQIGEMLMQGANATTNMPNSTAEERAMQREAVVRMAAEISDKFGFTDEVAKPFMAEVYRQVGMDSAADAGIATMRSDKYKSVQFNETPQHSWSGFIRDNVNEEVRQGLEQVLNKPIDLNNLDDTTLESVLFVIGYNDYGLKQEMFTWAFINNDLAENARTNFDSAISDPKFASVNQWQSDMRDFLKQFLV